MFYCYEKEPREYEILHIIIRQLRQVTGAGLQKADVSECYVLIIT